jgi:multicomponent Na+:H+ antiporter subunit D
MNSSMMEMTTASSGLIFGGAFVVLLVGVALYAVSIPQGNWRWWGLAALLTILIIASQAIGSGMGSMLLIDAAAFVAVALVWTQDSPQAKSAARTYLILLLVAVIFLAAGLALAGEGRTAPAAPLDKIAVTLLVVGFGLKLALVPFYFWLPGLTQYAKPMTAALVISIVDIAAFGEMVHLRLTTPWVFDDYTALWMTLAILSMIGGALLALGQRNIKRMLAYSTIDDMGYLMLGVLIGTRAGLGGAILVAVSHAFFKVILFGSVGVAESQSGRELTLDTRGMASRYPISAAVFIAGALGTIGVPPLFGFVGRWRLYLAGGEYGGPWLVLAMGIATCLAFLYYVRAFDRVWLGPADEKVTGAAEPKLASAVLIILVVLMLTAGLFPGWLTNLIG